MVECPPRPTHLPLLRRVDSTDHLLAWRNFDRILASDVLYPARKDPQDSWHLHRSDCTTTLIYAHTTSRTVLTCDVRLGSLTVSMPEAGDLWNHSNRTGTGRHSCFSGAAAAACLHYRTLPLHRRHHGRHRRLPVRQAIRFLCHFCIHAASPRGKSPGVL